MSLTLEPEQRAEFLRLCAAERVAWEAFIAARMRSTTRREDWPRQAWTELMGTRAGFNNNAGFMPQAMPALEKALAVFWDASRDPSLREPLDRYHRAMRALGEWVQSVDKRNGQRQG